MWNCELFASVPLEKLINKVREDINTIPKNIFGKNGEINIDSVVYKHYDTLRRLALNGQFAIVYGDFANSQTHEAITTLPEFNSLRNVIYSTNIADILRIEKRLDYDNLLTVFDNGSNVFVDALMGQSEQLRLHIRPTAPRYKYIKVDLWNWQLQYNKDCIASVFGIGKVYAKDDTESSGCRVWYMSPLRMARHLKEHSEIVRGVFDRLKLGVGAGRSRMRELCRSKNGYLLCVGTNAVVLGNIFNILIPYFVQNPCGLNQIEVFIYKTSVIYGFSPPEGIAKKMQACQERYAQEANIPKQSVIIEPTVYDDPKGCKDAMTYRLFMDGSFVNMVF